LESCGAPKNAIARLYYSSPFIIRFKKYINK
jgi:hypothetical protein